VDPRLSPDDLDPADLDLLRRGDVRGLEAVYRRFGSYVQRTCLALLGNRADADDAAQEVFMKAFEHARQFAGGSRFSTWLYRITVNHCLHAKEKRRVREAAPLHDLSDDAAICPKALPHDAASAQEARELVLDRLARLSEVHRAVLMLREIDGLSYDEIATVLDVPVGTVMSRLARARERWIELSPTPRVGERRS
jgi:RNA polymerase sigma-70 factor (ECF subfamily)